VCALAERRKRSHENKNVPKRQEYTALIYEGRNEKMEEYNK